MNLSTVYETNKPIEIPIDELSTVYETDKPIKIPIDEPFNSL